MTLWRNYVPLMEEHGTAHAYDDDMLSVERPGCIQVQRLRIDPAWFAIMADALEHMIAVNPWWGFDVASRELRRRLDECTTMSDIERRIVYVYATHGAEA